MSEDNPWGWMWDRFHDQDSDGQNDAAQSAGSGGILGDAGTGGQPQLPGGSSLPVPAQTEQAAATSPVDGYVSRAELPDAPKLETLGPRPVDPTCENAYACTSIDPETNKVQITYTPAYYELSPVARQSVDVHEAAHVPTVQDHVHWWRSGDDNNTALNNYAPAHQAEIETPAYQAQSDFLTNYVTNPNPYDAQAWQLWYDTQQKLDQLKGAKR